MISEFCPRELSLPVPNTFLDALANQLQETQTLQTSLVQEIMTNVGKSEEQLP